MKAFKVVLGFSFLNSGRKPAHFSHICSKKQKTVFNTKYNYAHFFFLLYALLLLFFVNSWTKLLYFKNFKSSKLSYTERSVKIQICILVTLLTFAIFESFIHFSTAAILNKTKIRFFLNKSNLSYMFWQHSQLILLLPLYFLHVKAKG